VIVTPYSVSHITITPSAASESHSGKLASVVSPRIGNRKLEIDGSDKVADEGLDLKHEMMRLVEVLPLCGRELRFLQ
jgi:hypothetical protein